MIFLLLQCHGLKSPSCPIFETRSHSTVQVGLYNPPASAYWVVGTHHHVLSLELNAFQRLTCYKLGPQPVVLWEPGPEESPCYG